MWSKGISVLKYVVSSFLLFSTYKEYKNLVTYKALPILLANFISYYTDVLYCYANICFTNITQIPKPCEYLKDKSPTKRLVK